MDEAEIVSLRLIDTQLSEYIIAFEDTLDQEAGMKEQRRYEDAVERLKRTAPETLLEYGEILDEFVAWGEERGFFGEYGLGEARNDFYESLGHLFMNLQYSGVHFEGCDGLC